MAINSLQQFGQKYIDIMIGIVLGLGFQWWTDLVAPWQYLAFIFIYLNLIDYWIDYSPTLKKYPLKDQVDIFIHSLIIFSMFLLTLATKKTLDYFLFAFILYRVGDLLWLVRIKWEYSVFERDRKFIVSWSIFDSVEILAAAAIIGAGHIYGISVLLLFLSFVIIRVTTRILASVSYKQLYYR